MDVLGAGPSTLSSIGLAAQHPASVRKLVLINPVLRWKDIFVGERGAAILHLAEADWDLFVETASHSRLGWSRQESTDFADLWRRSVTREDYLRLISVWREFDVSPLLPGVTAETLVVYGSASTWARTYTKCARIIASTILGTHVREIPEGSEGWLASPTILSAIDDFLGMSAERTQLEIAPSSGMTAILFADIVDSTALTERLGDAAFRAKARDLDAALRAFIREKGGTCSELAASISASLCPISRAAACPHRCTICD